MAEQSEDNAAEVKKHKRVPLKTLLVMLVVLLVEGAAISGTFLLAGGPAEVKAQGASATANNEAEHWVEVPLVSDRFQNTRTGRPYVYDTEIYIVVKQKYADKVKAMIKSIKAQIVTDIATIFRRAQPRELREPELATLTRQIRVLLERRLGAPDDEDTPYVHQVLIKKCMQFRGDL